MCKIIVIIDKHLHHEKNKICFGWQYEPEDYKKDIDILKRFPLYEFGFQALNDYEKDICNVCQWFNEPYINPKGVVYDHMQIHQIYDSPFAITNYIRGSTNNKYIQEYGSIETIDDSLIEHLEYIYQYISEFTNIHDENASQQFIDVLTFLKKWKNHSNIEILYINE